MSKKRAERMQKERLRWEKRRNAGLNPSSKPPWPTYLDLMLKDAEGPAVIPRAK